MIAGLWEDWALCWICGISVYGLPQQTLLPLQTLWSHNHDLPFQVCYSHCRVDGIDTWHVREIASRGLQPIASVLLPRCCNPLMIWHSFEKFLKFGLSLEHIYFSSQLCTLQQQACDCQSHKLLNLSTVQALLLSGTGFKNFILLFWDWSWNAGWLQIMSASMQQLTMAALSHILSRGQTMASNDFRPCTLYIAACSQVNCLIH